MHLRRRVTRAFVERRGASVTSDIIAAVSKAPRFGADVRAAKWMTSRRTKEAAERALAIAISLRERGDWLLTSASIYKGWTVESDGSHYRVESVASAFLEGPRAPGFVFGVTIRAGRGNRAITERVLSAPWFQGLQARLGKDYVNNHHRPERVGLVRVLRATSDPATILDELRHVAAAVEGKTWGRRLLGWAPSRRIFRLRRGAGDQRVHLRERGGPGPPANRQAAAGVGGRMFTVLSKEGEWSQGHGLPGRVPALALAR
jgi:hypothetical protein